ncbi:MAG: chemotaxis protein CheW [Burkholderiales bacterium]
MTTNLSEFYPVFFDESEEHLAAMERLLLGLDSSCASNDELNAIFRAAHSIKGSSSMFGFNDIADLTHELETLLDRLRKHEIALDPEMVETFLQTRDVIKAQLEYRRRGDEAPPEAAVAAIARLRALGTPAAHPVAAAAPNASPAQVLEIVLTPALSEYQYVETLIDALSGMGEVRSVARPADTDSDGGMWRIGLATENTVEKLQELCEFVLSPAAYSIEEAAKSDVPQSPEPPQAASAGQDEAYGLLDGAPGHPANMESENIGRRSTDDPALATGRSGRRASDKVVSPQSEMSSIRVGVDKVDKLINLVGELVITQAMLLQSGRDLDPVLHNKLLDGLSQLDRNTRDLQEAVMSIRMMPMSFAFSRYPRLVHDLAAKLGKRVELKTEGEATELDKGVIERLADPLTHLVRNSIDHGIELPEARSAAGKPPHGTLTLSAFQQGGSVFVRIEDDGAGLNRDRILAKARERGMAVSDQMSDAEVWELIYQPGFSTAAVVTDISGRGVGMDVVARNIKALGGWVEIESAWGKGTRVTVRLPLTLAILDGLSVAVGDELYILPLACIVESLQPVAEDMNTIGGRGRTVRVRGEYVPVLALHEIFGVHAQVADNGIVVIIEADGRKTALLVDALVGQQQVVIKSLESNYRKVPGVSGATILGDGRVALILDPVALADAARSTSERSRPALASQAAII